MRRMFAALILAAAPLAAQPANPPIDYAGFSALAEETAGYRDQRLLSWDEFSRASKLPGALILDARSADAFAAGHIRGAVNLPLTDFTAASLRELIGRSDRPIFIYCNNNFSNDQRPVPMKKAQLALNIQTFINLVGYGYPNVYELGEVIDFTDPKIGWVTGPAKVSVSASPE